MCNCKTAKPEFHQDVRKYNLPNNGIPESLFRDVLAEALPAADVHLYDPTEAIEDIGTDWLMREKNSAGLCGTFPKRLQKWAHRKFRAKIPQTVLAQIGTRCAAECVGATVYLSFAESIDWDSGDFHDGRSCYWSCRSGARQSITDSGGRAVLFWDSADREYRYPFSGGIGRCFLIQTGPKEFALWNLYHPDLTLWDVGRLLATQWGFDYRKIDITNNGSDSGLVWINSGRGMLIGADIANRTDVDLAIEEDDYNTVACHRCGEHIDPEDAYGHQDLHEIYCEQCYWDLFWDCVRCGETFVVGDDTPIECGRHSEWHCQYCADALGYRQCYDCEQWTDDYQTDQDDDIYCSDCADNYALCDCCNVLQTDDPSAASLPETADGNRYCADCARDNGFVAADDGTLLDSSRAVVSVGPELAPVARPDAHLFSNHVRDIGPIIGPRVSYHADEFHRDFGILPQSLTGCRRQLTLALVTVEIE